MIYSQGDTGSFNAALDAAITKKADYISEAGVPLTPSLINKVKAAGAKWALISVNPVDVQDPVIVNSNGFQNDQLMGQELASFVVADSNGKANVLVEHVPAFPILNGFTDGFQAKVKQLCASCKVKIQDITIPDLTAGKIPSIMVSALRTDRTPTTLPSTSARSRPASTRRSRRPDCRARSRSSVRPPTRRRSRPRRRAGTPLGPGSIPVTGPTWR